MVIATSGAVYCLVPTPLEAQVSGAEGGGERGEGEEGENACVWWGLEGQSTVFGVGEVQHHISTRGASPSTASGGLQVRGAW